MLTFSLLISALTIIFMTFAAMGLFRMLEAKEKKNYIEQKKYKKYFIVFIILGILTLILSLLTYNCYFEIMKYIVF